MGVGIMQAPLIDLTVTTPGGHVSAMPIRGRSDRRLASRPTTPYVVIAGSPRSGKTALTNALVRRTDPVPAGSWLLYRHGERAGTRAYVPGHRDARPLIPAQRDPRTETRPGPTRPARRVEVFHPARLLEHLSLLDTPGSGGREGADADILLDAAEDGLGLLFVVGAAAPLARADLDLLAHAVERADRIAFVLTRIDLHDNWPEMLAANRALLASRAPQLSHAPWFPVSLDGEEVFGVAELRHELRTWAQEQPEPAGVAAAPLAEPADDWEDLLDREVEARRLAAVQRVSIDLATIHVRCVQELGSGKGCPELPHVLDRELHALSVRTTRQLHADTREAIRVVFARLLSATPDELVIARVAGAARRVVDELRDRDRHHALLVTATSAVAAQTGAAAVDNLSAVGGAEPATQVLPALGVALNASCYAMWQPKVAPGGPPKEAEKRDCRRWLQHALREIEVEVGHELGERYADLRQALAVIAGDAVEHGVLLA